jgi:hypothetical protein
VLYGDQDDVVPATATTAAIGSACALGDVIESQQLPDAGQGIDPSATFTWIADRFHSVPPINTCAVEAPPQPGPVQ